MPKNQVKKTASILLLTTIIFTSFFYMGNQFAYSDNIIEPDITLYVHGEKSNGGPIFHQSGDIGNGLWAPGISHSGTMRIYNNYSERIKVSNLGLRMKLEQLQGQELRIGVDKELYELFAKNMKLTIKRGTMLVFTNTVYDKSFYEMLYDRNDENYKGYDLSPADKFNINSNDYIDLEYTVAMDKNAGNELQGLKATVDFIINSQENPEPKEPDKPHNPELPEKDEFVDVGGHWAHDCILTLIKHGIIQGYPDGTIRPDNYITRAETAVLVGKALGLEEEKGSTGYIDLIPGWAKGYIKSTTTNNIFTGYPNKTFKPNKNITREEMTAVLMRAFDKALENDIELSFTDKESIGNWALAHVKAGVEHKVIEGYPDNTFKPKNNITRAEAFTIICKLLGYHQEHE